LSKKYAFSYCRYLEKV